jgi:hypothetical protein
MLGSAKPLTWVQNENGITIELPDVPPCQYAYTLKLAGK